MLPTEVATPSVVPAQARSGYTVKRGAAKVGLFDNGIHPRLNSPWQARIHTGIRNWYGFGGA